MNIRIFVYPISFTNPRPRARLTPEVGEAHLSRVGVRISPGYSSDVRFVLRSPDLSPCSLPTSPIPLIFPAIIKTQKKILCFYYGAGKGNRTPLIRLETLGNNHYTIPAFTTFRRGLPRQLITIL